MIDRITRFSYYPASGPNDPCNGVIEEDTDVDDDEVDDLDAAELDELNEDHRVFKRCNSCQNAKQKMRHTFPIVL